MQYLALTGALFPVHFGTHFALFESWHWEMRVRKITSIFKILTYMKCFFIICHSCLSNIKELIEIFFFIFILLKLLIVLFIWKPFWSSFLVLYLVPKFECSILFSLKNPSRNDHLLKRICNLSFKFCTSKWMINHKDNSYQSKFSLTHANKYFSHPFWIFPNRVEKKIL